MPVPGGREGRKRGGEPNLLILSKKKKNGRRKRYIFDSFACEGGKKERREGLIS